MKNTKHIDGPWSWSGVGPKGSERVIFKATDTTSYPIAVVRLDHLDRFGSGDTDTTARLIAMAPTLLELARFISGSLDEFGQCTIKNGDAMDRIVTEILRKVDGGGK